MKFKDGGDFVRSLYENGDCELFDRNRRVSIDTQLLVRRFDEATAWQPIGRADKSRQILALAKDHAEPLTLRWFKYNGVEAWRDWDGDAQEPLLFVYPPPHPELFDKEKSDV